MIVPETQGFPFSSLHSKEQTTDMVLQAQLVGLIDTISTLSQYANDIFSSILQESTGIANHIASLGQRCVALQQSAPIVEAFHQSISPFSSPPPSPPPPPPSPHILSSFLYLLRTYFDYF